MSTFYVQTYANPPLMKMCQWWVYSDGVLCVYDVTLNPPPDRKFLSLNCTRGSVLLGLGMSPWRLLVWAIIHYKWVRFSLECFLKIKNQIKDKFPSQIVFSKSN